MEEEKKENLGRYNREEIYANRVRAERGRTYFFDVRATRANEYFLTLTESKKRFDEEKGTFYYRKHKIYLFKEDFEKFSEGLDDAMDFVIKNNPTNTKKEEPEKASTKEPSKDVKDKSESDTAITDDLKDSGKADIKFEDLEKEE